MTKTVLLVEDNDLFARVYEGVVSALGADSIRARTATEGIDIAGETPVDLVIMDLNLPDMNGLDAIDRLRADPKTAGLKIAIVSTRAAMADRNRVEQSGCVAVIAKPIDVPQFSDTLSRLLEL